MLSQRPFTYYRGYGIRFCNAIRLINKASNYIPYRSKGIIIDLDLILQLCNLDVVVKFNI